jgi:hypothetical protein
MENPGKPRIGDGVDEYDPEPAGGVHFLARPTT